MGAWIETSNGHLGARTTTVAPLVGAWIETEQDEAERKAQEVAPLVGAWIETNVQASDGFVVGGRAPCGRVD